jgi:hypothetical protein
MIKICAGLIIATALISIPSGASKCNCEPAAEKTRAGANEWVVYKEPLVHKKAEGVVVLPSPDRQQDLLVEIFDRPDYLMCEWRANNPNKCSKTTPPGQRRLGACKTGKHGKFCFDNIPAGNYELRISKGPSWSVTHVYLVIDPKDSKSSSTPIQISMRPGT